MTAILCATDFSPAADQAAGIAAALGRALNRPVELLHVVQLPATTPPDLTMEMVGAFRAIGERELDRRVAALSGPGLTVTSRVEVGPTDDTILAAIDAARASLLVVGNHGRRGVRRFLGSVAERLVRRAPCPVLVAPDSWVRMREWTPGARPLRVVAAVDGSPATEVALEALREIVAATPCQVELVHTYWPPHDRDQLGPGYSRDAHEPDPLLVEALDRDLRKRFRRFLDTAGMAAQVRPCLPGTETQEPVLVHAGSSQADLVVLGHDGREQASTVIPTLRGADLPVLCVRLDADADTAPRAGFAPVRCALVPIDFSPLSRDAVAHAYRLLARGGRVILCHVADGGPGGLDPEVRDDLEKSLIELVPAYAAGAGVRTHTVVYDDADAGRGIVHVARRLAADVVVMSSHGRGGLQRAVFGSVADSVVRAAPMPVLVVPPRERSRS